MDCSVTGTVAHVPSPYGDRDPAIGTVAPARDRAARAHGGRRAARRGGPLGAGLPAPARGRPAAAQGRAGRVDELDRLRREHAEAREQSRRDSLTASYNRRYLDERLATLLDDPRPARHGRAVGRARRRRPLQAGQRHLRAPASATGCCSGSSPSWAAACPAGAFCARYGGEEFALVLPGRDTRRRPCGSARPPATASPATPGTSCGRAARDGQRRRRALRRAGRPRWSGWSATADTLLYTAKQSGRNAVAFRDAGTGFVRLAGRRGRAAGDPATAGARAGGPAAGRRLRRSHRPHRPCDGREVHPAARPGDCAPYAPKIGGPGRPVPVLLPLRSEEVA